MQRGETCFSLPPCTTAGTGGTLPADIAGAAQPPGNGDLRVVCRLVAGRRHILTHVQARHLDTENQPACSHQQVKCMLRMEDAMLAECSALWRRWLWQPLPCFCLRFLSFSLYGASHAGAKISYWQSKRRVPSSGTTGRQAMARASMMELAPTSLLLY